MTILKDFLGDTDTHNPKQHGQTNMLENDRKTYIYIYGAGILKVCFLF